MSTIVVAKKNGYVAIGADTLTKYGATKEAADFIVNNSKIMKVDENYIASSGHASGTMILENYFSDKQSVPNLSTVNDIFNFSLQFHKDLKDQYFLRPEEDSEDEFESIQMRCLIANPYGIFGLYQLRSISEYSKFYAMGCGYPFALGAMNAIYDSADSAETIVKVGLEAASTFDDATASPFEIYSIKLNK